MQLYHQVAQAHEHTHARISPSEHQEHYEEAAEMRDKIKQLKMQDPYAKAEIEVSLLGG
jgi:protein-arginine kinase activator protein McsA